MNTLNFAITPSRDNALWSCLWYNIVWHYRLFRMFSKTTHWPFFEGYPKVKTTPRFEGYPNPDTPSIQSFTTDVLHFKQLIGHRLCSTSQYIKKVPGPPKTLSIFHQRWMLKCSTICYTACPPIQITELCRHLELWNQTRIACKTKEKKGLHDRPRITIHVHV